MGEFLKHLKQSKITTDKFAKKCCTKTFRKINFEAKIKMGTPFQIYFEFSNL